MPEEQQIAGINRHPEMLDSTARRDDRRRDHVAPVDNGRRPVNQQNVDAVAHRVADQRRQVARQMRAALLQGQGAAERPQPALGHSAGFIEDALLEPGKPCLNQADRERPEWRDAEEWTLGNGRLDTLFDSVLRGGEWDDLYSGNHLPRLDDRK